MNQGNEIDFNSNKTSVSAEKVEKNAGWHIISANAAKSVTYFFHKKKGLISIPKINVYVDIKRLPSAEAAYVFIPAVIFIMMNIVVLLMDSKIRDRFLVIGLNIIFHFIFMSQLTLLVPYNAEKTPIICKFSPVFGTLEWVRFSVRFF
jgi:hypothetical protein